MMRAIAWGDRMQVRVLRRAGLIVVLLLLGVAAALAQTAEEIAKLNQQASALYDARKYSDALAVQRKVVAGTERLERAR
jgi:hypothetical protein